jgi:chaperonin GroES
MPKKKPLVAFCYPTPLRKSPRWAKWCRLVPGKRSDDGSFQTMEVKVGDKVLYSKYAGTDLKLGTDEYVLLRESDVLATLA